MNIAVAPLPSNEDVELIMSSVEEAMEAISRLEENSHQSDWQRDSDLRKLRAYVLSKQ